jgi:hypothetical protein
VAPAAEEHPSFDTQTVVGLVIWFLCVLYSSITTSSARSGHCLVRRPSHEDGLFCGGEVNGFCLICRCREKQKDVRYLCTVPILANYYSQSFKHPQKKRTVGTCTAWPAEKKTPSLCSLERPRTGLSHISSQTPYFAMPNAIQALHCACRYSFYFPSDV